MIYLLDANVLIDANRDYYPIDRVPEFWAWLVHQGEADSVKIPLEIYEEVKDGNDQLAQWAKEDNTEAALLLGEAADPTLALTDVVNRTIVTTEVSKPGRVRLNRHIPDVCDTFGIRCRNTFEFVRELDFSTNWQG